MKTTHSVALSLMLCLSAVSGARADCLTPEPRLLWTYPAEGEKDVPTNAVFWVLMNTTYIGLGPSVALDGQPVSASTLVETKPSSGVSSVADEGQIRIDDLRIDPGPLAPDASHMLSLTYKPMNGSPESVFELHFTTGPGPKERLSRKPRVVGHKTYAVEDAAVVGCPTLISVQGCFDTVDPIPTRISSLEIEPASALAWFVRTDRESGSMLWPAKCGDPSLAVRQSRGDECFEIRAIGDAGKLSPATRFCSNEQLPRKHQKARANAEQALRLGWKSSHDLMPIEPVRVGTQPPPVDEVEEADRAPSHERREEPRSPVARPPAPAAEGACNAASTVPSSSGLCALLVALSLASARRGRRSARPYASNEAGERK